jgi:hypothetical protein
VRGMCRRHRGDDHERRHGKWQPRRPHHGYQVVAHTAVLLLNTTLSANQLCYLGRWSSMAMVMKLMMRR